MGTTTGKPANAATIVTTSLVALSLLTLRS